jgi:hypothetical protein
VARNPLPSVQPSALEAADPEGKLGKEGSSNQAANGGGGVGGPIDASVFRGLVFVCMLTREFPHLGLEAARIGKRLNYRNDHPFDYSVNPEQRGDRPC